MNKTYIKRQLTLNELGIPMDKDISKYYQIFKKYIDKEKLFIDTGYDSELISYRKTPNDKIILIYDKNTNCFHMLANIYDNFRYDCKLKYQARLTYNLSCTFLEYQFSFKTNDLKLIIF